MLKISPVELVNHAATLRLEGRVIGPWVAELRRACEQLLQEGRALRLDLAGVSFADRHGIALFLRLRTRGVSLVDCPPLVEEELKALAHELPAQG